MLLPIVYSPEMTADDAGLPSPSARKPRLLAEAAVREGLHVTWIAPEPISVADLEAVHDSAMVRDILACRRANGFGTVSPTIASSLLYTNGAMLTGCRRATTTAPTAVFASGFHHATWDQAQMYCTFNGLMAAAVRLLRDGVQQRIAIVDADQHYGNGTDDILDRLQLRSSIWHYTFGATFHHREQAMGYIRKLYELEAPLVAFAPGLIIYQAGADAHEDDPLGGVLDDDGMYHRDLTMFRIARRLGVPIVWNLAGGYRTGADGGLGPVIQTHLATFRAALAAWG